MLCCKYIFKNNECSKQAGGNEVEIEMATMGNPSSVGGVAGPSHGSATLGGVTHPPGFKLEQMLLVVESWHYIEEHLSEVPIT